MPTRAWFPTLVYDAPLLRGGPGAFHRSLLRECLQIRDVDEEGRRWSRDRYPGGFTSYHSMHQLHRTSPTFAELERHLRGHVRAFARSLDLDLRGRALAMTDCWVNVMGRSSAHGLHLHPISTISGTYYVKTPRGSPAIKFEDPRLSSFMAAPPRRVPCRAKNRTFVSYPARAGHVILFESWLRHEVAAHPGPSERVSVSFNWNWF